MYRADALKNEKDGIPVKILGVDKESIQKHFPELVSFGSEGEVNIYTMKFIPILIKAFQEQQETTRSYKNKIETQSEEISQLRIRLDELTNVVLSLQEK